MANKGFNGSTISVGNSAQTPLRRINFNNDCAKVKVSGGGDNGHTYIPGLPDKSVECEIVGAGGPAEGASGTITIAWNDNTSESLSNGVVVSRKTTGSLDGEILATVTVVPLGTTT